MKFKKKCNQNNECFHKKKKKTPENFWIMQNFSEHKIWHKHP